MSLPFLFGILSAAIAAETRVAAGAVAAARMSITAPDLRAHIDVLADDTFEGREAGARGGHAAAGYLAQQLARHDLRPAGIDGGFAQPFGPGYRNVLGLVAGSDPDVRQQVIVVGAHYDHVGYGNATNSYGPTGYIHNGADDNASGTAALLELAEALAALPSAPRRSILLAFWDGEEKGLLGSKHWLSAPTISLPNVRAAINVDMVGRLREERVEIFGVRTGTGLRRLCAGCNQEAGLRLDFSWELKANSDHYPFIERGIPCVMLHTGLHRDYHRPSDDAHLLNTPGLERVTRLLFDLVLELANRSDLPSFRPEATRETVAEGKRLEAPSGPPLPRLGVTWHEGISRGLLLSRVEPESPAAMAGIRTGDRLLACNDEPIRDGDSFRGTIRTAPASVVLTVARGDGSAAERVNVALAGTPERIGIAWREDHAEPGTIVLTRVTPGTLAERAGLRLRDRISAVNGRSFRSHEFAALVTAFSDATELVVEREGRLLTVTLGPNKSAAKEE